MSRRCKREGVEWDDGRFPCQRGATSFDAMHGGYGFGHYLARPRKLMWRALTEFHARRMEHLRERPLLPPWWTQEMLDRAHARAAEWHAIFLDADSRERESL